MSDLARVLPWSQDEAELVMELQGGSNAAFDWLVTHYSGSVYSLVAGMVSESCDAADITQDVFLKAFRGIRGFRQRQLAEDVALSDRSPGGVEPPPLVVAAPPPAGFD